MFKDKHFYHQHIRKAIIAFGTLFNQIQVKRTDSDGNVVQSLFVPLSYAPKQKFIDRISEVPDLGTDRTAFAITLPRMGFEITNLTYDAARKLAVTQTIRNADAASSSGVRHSFVSTPYNLGISLSVFAKNQDDALQIVEQIFPFFNPDFNVTINEIPELGVKRDLQIILDSVNYDDQWEGGFDKRLSVIWDFNFTVKINFYGNVQDSVLIKKTIQNIYLDTALLNGVPTNNVVGKRITTYVDPFNALPTDAYNFITEFDDIYTEDL